MKWYNGEKRVCSIRRLKCERCQRLHSELPDVMTPHKHYATEIIENVVDGVSTPDDLSTEDYPCERTMQRWKDWIQHNQQQIDGQLKSIVSCISSSGYKLLENGDSLLQKLREEGAGWLSAINRTIYNTGNWIPSGIRYNPYAPALS